MANEFIWHNPVEAQQAMSYAANAAKADLAKQENLFRMAELGLRRQQQQETAQLNQLLTANQLQQRQIENQFRERELSQRADLERERNKNILEGYKIQFQDRVDPRLAIEQERQRFELEEQKKDEARDNVLIQEWQKLETDINAMTGEVNQPLPSTGFLGLSRGALNERRKGDETKRATLGTLRQRQQAIEAILAERGKVPPRLSPAAPPTVSQMSLPQALQQPNIPVPSFLGMPPQILPQQDNLPRYETVQEALAAGHTSGQIVRVRHPITGVYARYQIE